MTCGDIGTGEAFVYPGNAGPAASDLASIPCAGESGEECTASACCACDTGYYNSEEHSGGFECARASLALAPPASSCMLHAYRPRPTLAESS